MAFHPNDLEHMTFSTVRRGFDPSEVRSYLVSVAATIRHEERENDQGNQPSAEVARNDAKAILLAAQDTAESIRAEARRQADQIRSDAAEQTKAAAIAASPAVHPSPVPAAQETSEAERRLQNKARQLEALRAEIERLHDESGKAVRTASDERRAAERVRAESVDEIARLRQELNALQTRAGSAGVTSSGMRVQIPGTVDKPAKTLDTASLNVIDSSVSAPPSPLMDAVKSAVGRAIKH